MSPKPSLFSGNGYNFSNEFDLKDKLGEGSFSEVWLCVRRSDGAELAAKILKKHYGRAMDTAAWTTISEVTVATSIGKHPYLLTMEEVYHDVESGKVILVTELMKKSLYDVIDGGQCVMTDARIKCYMYQMLEGLKYLHENGFIHRDIKPENILLRAANRLLKIGDFGTACHVSDGLPYAEYVATRWYRPPECALTRGRYGTKMDIWAAGCVLYEMATCRPLFDGRDGDDQMDKIERVLGSPGCRLIDRFRRHKSDLLVARHETGGRAGRAGVGLHAVYRPYRPSYELLKEMIVYDPIKRFSADRLLRKPYFHEMRGTAYERNVMRFEMGLRASAANGGSSTSSSSSSSSSAAAAAVMGETLVPTTRRNTDDADSDMPTSKIHGPGGDRVPPPPPVETITGRRRPANRKPEHAANPLTAFGRPINVTNNSTGRVNVRPPFK